MLLQNAEYRCLIRATDGKKKIATEVLSVKNAAALCMQSTVFASCAGCNQRARAISDVVCYNPEGMLLLLQQAALAATYSVRHAVVYYHYL